MKKHYNVDFLRLTFSLLIVLYHLVHSNIMPYVGEHNVYLNIQEMTGWSSAIVDCFLIISGYFIYVSYKGTPNKPFMEYAIYRFVRLWPVFVFYTIFTLLLGGGISEDTLLDLALLRCTGISLSYKGIIWYIAPFFWSSLLVYAILKYCKPGVSGLVLALISYFGYAINLNNSNGGLGRQVIYGFLSLGILRVLAGICLGCLIGVAMYSSCVHITFSYKKIKYFIVSCLEIACYIMLHLIFLTNVITIKNAFSVVILFTILFICFIRKKGLLSSLLSQPIFTRLGKYSYSIYVMQQISFNILAKTVWQNTLFICNHVFLTIMISLCFTALLGIATYYIVEKPAAILLKKMITIDL